MGHRKGLNGTTMLHTETIWIERRRRSDCRNFPVVYAAFGLCGSYDLRSPQSMLGGDALDRKSISDVALVARQLVSSGASMENQSVVLVFARVARIVAANAATAAVAGARAAPAAASAATAASAVARAAPAAASDKSEAVLLASNFYSPDALFAANDVLHAASAAETDVLFAASAAILFDAAMKKRSGFVSRRPVVRLSG